MNSCHLEPSDISFAASRRPAMTLPSSTANVRGLPTLWVAFAIAMALWPLDLGPANIVKRPPTTASGPAAEPALMEPDAYAVLYRGNLRRPLFDPPPAAVNPKTTSAPAMPVGLVGTAFDPDYPLASFRGANGEPKWVGVGESIDGVEMLSIEATSVKVRFAGKEITLTAPKEDGGK